MTARAYLERGGSEMGKAPYFSGMKQTTPFGGRGVGGLGGKRRPGTYGMPGHGAPPPRGGMGGQKPTGTIPDRMGQASTSIAQNQGSTSMKL